MPDPDRPERALDWVPSDPMLGVALTYHRSMEQDVGWIRDGFPGERMTVLPRPRLRDALASPATSALVVTDVGFFPHALHHGRQREVPVTQAIILICARGRGWVRSNEVTHQVGPGQFVVIPPGLAHAYGSADDDPWTLWWMHVDGTLVREWCAIAGLGDNVAVRTLPDDAEAIGLAQQILVRMQTDTSPPNVLAAAGAAWHLLTLLMIRQLRVDSTATTIEESARYLREHYADRISVADLAARARLSSSHFALLFRQQVGQSTHAYQTELRMARARELLDTTPIPVAEVARAVGYDDPFYFTRQFRRIHGVTPRAYRAQDKG